MTPSRTSFAAGLTPSHAVLILLLTALAYRNVLVAGFQFDDFNVIVLNNAVHSLQAWWASMPGIRPLLKLSYCLNWLVESHPRAFHITNLIIHLANSILVYLLFQHWAHLTLADASRAKSIALSGALLFALHPANTEAVTYISGRSVSQMALFYLTAGVVFLTLYIRSRPARIWANVLPLFVLALSTKETAWTFPLALSLILWMSRKPALRSTWPAWLLGLAGMIVLLGIEHYRELIANSLETRGLVENLFTQAEGIYYLITRPLLGLHINIDPDIPVHLVFSDKLTWKVLWPLLLMGLAASQMRRRPWLALGIFWFFLHLLPTNSVLARFDVANDRQLYLAMLGPIFILAVMLQKLSAPIRLPAFLALVLILASTTYSRNDDYRDEISLWLATTRDSPNKPRAWNNLGYAYQLANDKNKAIAAYQRALALDPDYSRARTNLDQVRQVADPS